MDQQTAVRHLICAFVLAVTVVVPAQSEEARRAAAASRTPLGTSPAQLLLAKITVSDLPRSYAFYTKVIGLKRALSAAQPAPTTDPVPANDSQPTFIEIALNNSGTLADPFFVLVQQRGDLPTPASARLTWVGLKVPDAPAAVRRVREGGYEVVREAAVVGPGEMSIGIVRDPDGYSVELIQSASYPAVSH
jgi:catechol 2,3-dioxygenase-like lactoylglutathione lyase family enzyme